MREKKNYIGPININTFSIVENIRPWGLQVDLQVTFLYHIIYLTVDLTSSGPYRSASKLYTASHWVIVQGLYQDNEGQWALIMINEAM